MTTSNTGLTLVVLGLIAAGACVDETLDPLGSGGGGAGGDGGAGGSGGAAPPSRGNPEDFPSECIDSCEAACARLEECGAASSSLYPLGTEECMTRCTLAEGGPVWGDISAHFKCCASQEECNAVQHCGGWLDHPDPVESCKKLCTCFFSSADEPPPAELAALTAGHEAPSPYRFATHMVMGEIGNQSTPVPEIGGAFVTRSGRYLGAQLDSSATGATLAQLASLGRLLPTFVDRDGRMSAATGRVFVHARTPIALLNARAVAARRPTRMGAPWTSKGVSRAIVGRDLYTFEHADPWDALDAVRDLRAAGLDAELDMVRPHVFHYIPDDPLFPEQWHLRNTGQGPSTDGVDARVSEAWDVTLGDPAVVIAINDDGVNLHHADFAGRLLPELNYPPDWEARMAMGQFAGHGTSVAGVAAASANDQIGGVGVCPGCSVQPHMLALTDGFGGFMLSDSDVATGFHQQVDEGAWVINNSWGLGLGNPVFADEDMTSPGTPAIISGAFDYCETNGRGGLGTVVVYAAGNENTGVDYYNKDPRVVSVAAIGDLGLKSYYSSFGPEVDIGAPSNGALTGITTSSVGGGHTDSFGGTSSASPLITGVFGLIFSANPGLTAAQARQILADSAIAIDPVFGAYDAGRSPYYGAGRVNAYTAVRLAEGSCAAAADCPAPSDACGSQCGTRTACGPCRTPADCAAGYGCQALPSLGRTVCVAEKGGGACADGTTERNGYCVPSAATCGVCLGSEECNGRDDDCDGAADEDDVCGGPALCFIDSPACADDGLCAAISCAPPCTIVADCAEGLECRTIKDQYGHFTGQHACIQNNASGCPLGCSVLASSLDDATLAQFVDCMMNGQVQCNGAFTCAGLLPVNF